MKIKIFISVVFMIKFKFLKKTNKTFAIFKKIRNISIIYKQKTFSLLKKNHCIIRKIQKTFTLLKRYFKEHLHYFKKINKHLHYLKTKICLIKKTKNICIIRKILKK